MSVFDARRRSRVTPDPGERFEREYGCTESEWLRWMPAATQGQPCHSPEPRTLGVALAGGMLWLRWQALEPRAIALMRMPRLQVHFAYEGVAAAERIAFQQGFDLRLLRGGG